MESAMAKSKKDDWSDLPDWLLNYQPPKDGFGADFAKAMVGTLRAAATQTKPRPPRGPR